MRDQDLMKRAQRAAAELERAWYRWRSGQGPQSEPVLTVTSYVGYSVNEPIGEPRVVFGVTASDAELLADLLARRAPVPLPVPPQAPPVLAEQPGFRAEAKSRLPEPAASRISATTNQASGQVVATIVTRPEAARAPTPADPRAETRADLRAETRTEAGGPPAAGDGAAPSELAPVAGGANGDRANAERPSVAVAEEAPSEAADQRPARLLPNPVLPPGNGPWALAASAARLEAETRIRAAVRPAPAEAASEAEAGAETPSEPKGRPEVAAGARTRYSADRAADGDGPEAKSPDPGELALAWGGPAFSHAQGDRAAVLRLPRKPDAGDSAAQADGLASFADDQPVLPAAAAEGRRARAARGYPVQRMQRVRRQSAVPGA